MGTSSSGYLTNEEGPVSLRPTDYIVTSGRLHSLPDVVLVRPGDYIVTLFVFYIYKFTGKLTPF